MLKKTNDLKKNPKGPAKPAVPEDIYEKVLTKKGKKP